MFYILEIQMPEQKHMKEVNGGMFRKKINFGAKKSKDVYMEYENYEN